MVFKKGIRRLIFGSRSAFRLIIRVAGAAMRLPPLPQTRRRRGTEGLPVWALRTVGRGPASLPGRRLWGPHVVEMVSGGQLNDSFYKGIFSVRTCDRALGEPPLYVTFLPHSVLSEQGGLNFSKSLGWSFCQGSGLE